MRQRHAGVNECIFSVHYKAGHALNAFLKGGSAWLCPSASCDKGPRRQDCNAVKRDAQHGRETYRVCYLGVLIFDIRVCVNI